VGYRELSSLTSGSGFLEINILPCAEILRFWSLFWGEQQAVETLVSAACNFSGPCDFAIGLVRFP
jgi:hypothetical protein